MLILVVRIKPNLMLYYIYTLEVCIEVVLGEEFNIVLLLALQPLYNSLSHGFQFDVAPYRYSLLIP
jgi:hypothetical protein